MIKSADLLYDNYLPMKNFLVMCAFISTTVSALPYLNDNQIRTITIARSFGCALAGAHAGFSQKHAKSSYAKTAAAFVGAQGIGHMLIKILVPFVSPVTRSYYRNHMGKTHLTTARIVFLCFGSGYACGLGMQKVVREICCVYRGMQGQYPLEATSLQQDCC